MRIIKKVFGTRNDRLVKSYRRIVSKINKLEEGIKALDDKQLAAKTDEFKQRLSEGQVLSDILPEAFAVVREAAFRTLGMRPFDVQLIGGMVLNDGKIAEMRTGEGKTLVATMPVYLNALTGEGVHVVTVNDYLAERDANWMRPVYEFLGLTVGINLNSMTPEEKQQAYAADITYGTNNEFGFDYLRDNMVYDVEECVQRKLSFAVIDEVDSILIDEARTPLIISGQAEASSDLYNKIGQFIPSLTLQKMAEDEKEEDLPEERLGDYTLDEKSKQAFLTDRGHQKIETILVKEGLLGEGESLYDYKNIMLMHYVGASLRAYSLYQRDVDYVVKNGEVIIVDEHTGRLMDGRRWSDGLHQAVEAKENVNIQLENQTLASITFQNYFRLYRKLSGMTGTADTEAFELRKIYSLEVVVVPTNRPMARKDHSDKVFLDIPSKYNAILDEIKECRERQQPVLVGTASIESSEMLAKYLTQEKVPHEILNAKQNEREALIIAQAGKPGSVTIATNMAGRGTDIVLGGNVEFELEALQLKQQKKVKKPALSLVGAESGGDEPQDNQWALQEKQIRSEFDQQHQTVLEAGGLHVLCTERHESRRIDNQLRGRSGRQGDPGSSQFFISLEDNLIRIFDGGKMQERVRRIGGMEEGDFIQSPFIDTSIGRAQRRVEGHNFDIRKQLLEYDDVANDQRKVIYEQRRRLLEAGEIERTVKEIREEALEKIVYDYLPAESLEEQWDVAGLEQALSQQFMISEKLAAWLDENGDLGPADAVEKVQAAAEKRYEAKLQDLDSDTMRMIEKSVMLQILDTHWKDHLAAVDYLRQSIGFRGYAQKNPAQEFKRESFEMFQEMMDSIKVEFTSTLLVVDFANPPEEAQQPMSMKLTYEHQDVADLEEQAGAPVQSIEGDEQQQPFRRDQPKVGRNDPCPCGSGKKYKQCCGRL